MTSGVRTAEMTHYSRADPYCSSSRGLADNPPQPMVVGHPTYLNAGSCLRVGRQPYSGPVLHPKWVSWLRCFRTT